MSLFEYVMVIASVIAALTFGQLLISVAVFVQRRNLVTTFRPHSIWLATLYLLAVLGWWAQWDLAQIEWTFVAYFWVIVVATLLFFAVALITPAVRDSPVDLEAHFMAVRRPFLGILLVLMTMGWFDGAIFVGQSAWGVAGLVHVTWTIALLLGLGTENERAQTLAATTGLGLVLFVMAVRFFPGALN